MAQIRIFLLLTQGNLQGLCALQGGTHCVRIELTKPPAPQLTEYAITIRETDHISSCGEDHARYTNEVPLMEENHIGSWILNSNPAHPLTPCVHWADFLNPGTDMSTYPGSSDFRSQGRSIRFQLASLA